MANAMAVGVVAGTARAVTPRRGVCAGCRHPRLAHMRGTGVCGVEVVGGQLCECGAYQAARMRWELRFNGVPPINQNSRGHWRKKAEEIAQWRCVGGLFAKAAGIPPLTRARFTATIFRRNLNVADEPGDWERLKPIIDGIVDAGVVPKDTRQYVEYGRCAEAHGQPSVTLIVEAL